MGHRQQWGAGVLVASAGLLALVAVTADGRPLQAPLSKGRVDVSVWVLTFGLLAFVLGVAIAVGSLWSLARRRDPGLVPPRRRSRWRTVLALALGLVVLLLFAPASRGGKVPPPTLVDRPTVAAPTDPSPPHRSPLWPFVLLGGVVTAALAVALSPRRRGTASTDAAAAGEPEGPAVAFDASLAALVDDPDPRTAVIAAYRVLLAGFGRCGLGRRAAEAPHEHLRRALASLAVRPGPLEELADLYDAARFSEHTLTANDRDRALAAFAAARDDLRAAVA